MTCRGLGLVLLLACGPEVGTDPPPVVIQELASVHPGPLVLLVSLDTTRADALSCYDDVAGWGLDLSAGTRPSPSTPILDGLAADGVRFRWALAHAPTTLASHASVFLGEDTQEHGVYRNGVPLPLDRPLLTEALGEIGYESIGVVGATVLDRDMGLSRGFSVYDDAVQEQVRLRTEDPAERVNSRVLDALDARSDPSQPLFLFVHYFDAHSPWQSASAEMVERFVRPGYQGVLDGSGSSLGALTHFSREGILGTEDRIHARGLYLAEVSHVDQALGRLLEELGRRGYLDDSLVVAFGDHGEILDEERARAYGHGTDVDLAAIHVPLILRGRGEFSSVVPGGELVDAQASLMNLPATLLEIVDGRTKFGSGHSLLSRGDRRPMPHFAEATKPHIESSGWPNTTLERAVVMNQAIYLRAPWLDQEGALYKLAPGQPTLDLPTMAHELARVLDSWEALAPGIEQVEMGAETQRQLQALGYIE